MCLVWLTLLFLFDLHFCWSLSPHRIGGPIIPAPTPPLPHPPPPPARFPRGTYPNHARDKARPCFRVRTNSYPSVHPLRSIQAITHQQTHDLKRHTSLHHDFPSIPNVLDLHYGRRRRRRRRRHHPNPSSFVRNLRRRSSSSSSLRKEGRKEGRKEIGAVRSEQCVTQRAELVRSFTRPLPRPLISRHVAKVARRCWRRWRCWRDTLRSFVRSSSRLVERCGLENSVFLSTEYEFM